MATVLILALVRVAAALKSPGPDPTPSGLGTASLHQGFTPRPTGGPDVRRVDLKLLKRDVYPNVCGWVDGVQESSITCSLGRTCYFYTSTGVWGMRGCCTGIDFLNCGWATACIDSASYSASCKSDCQNDPFTQKCTDILSPYCYSYRYPGASVVDYGCGPTKYSSFRIIETTYAGQSIATYNFRFASLSLASDGLPSNTAGYADPTNTASSDAGNNGLQRARPRRRSSLGPIVGGVVGGLAILGAVIAIALFFILRQRRRRRQQLPPGAPGQPGAGTQYAPGPVPPPGYGPVAQDAQPPMQQSSPHPQYHAPVPTKVDKPYDAGAQTQYPPPHSPVPSGEPTMLGGTPLPAYNRDSYMSVPGQDPSPPPHNVHQLHSQSVSPPPPPANVYQLHSESASPPPPINRVSMGPPGPGSGPVYEAPGQEVRR